MKFWFFFKRFAEKNIKHDVNKRIIRNFATSTKLRTMKKIIMTLILVLPLTAAAQNSWEIQEKTQAEKRAELEKRERELKKEQEALKREEKALKLAAKESKVKEKKEKKVKEEKVKVEKPAAAPVVGSVPASEPAPAPIQAGSGTKVLAPLPGTITEIPVKVGDAVAIGDTVIVLEAMKMQNNIEAETSGTVTSILVSKGDTVMEGAVLVTIG